MTYKKSNAEKFQDWKDFYYNDLFEDWSNSKSQMSFDNYCKDKWRERKDD